MDEIRRVDEIRRLLEVAEASEKPWDWEYGLSQAKKDIHYLLDTLAAAEQEISEYRAEGEHAYQQYIELAYKWRFLEGLSIREGERIWPNWYEITNDAFEKLAAAEQDRKKFIEAGINEHHLRLEAEQREAKLDTENAKLFSAVAFNSQRSEQLEKYLRAVLDGKEWKLYGGFEFCEWCENLRAAGHKPDCPRQAAVKLLEGGQ